MPGQGFQGDGAGGFPAECFLFSSVEKACAHAFGKAGHIGDILGIAFLDGVINGGNTN
ncbi:hypothetical protein SDC9_182207 [bioreactor metagenome]|uniref:Uncharacterized protein n=1 Tax=bioreactor metagenome TaxID=1076179 RepID=A0A645HGC4_9ZZZZ